MVYSTMANSVDLTTEANKYLDTVGDLRNLSTSDLCLSMAAHTEAAYGQMMEAIGVKELAVFEATGSEIVYEADEAAKTSFKEKVKKFFAQIIAWIKKAYAAVADKLDEMFNASRKAFQSININTIKKNWESYKNLIPADTVFGKAHLNPAYGTDTKSGNSILASAAAGSYDFNWAKKAADLVDTFAKNPGQDAGNMNDICNSIFGGINATISNSDDLIKWAKDKYLGEEKEIKKDNFNFAKVEAYVLAGSLKHQIKKAYRPHLAAIEKVAKSASKTEGAQNLFTYAKNVATIVNTVYITIINCTKTQYQEAKNVLAAACRALMKAMHTKEGKEITSTNKKNAKADELQKKADELKGASESAMIDALFDFM